ncbi:DUF1223 domain-containing protein [Rudaea sp.]|uniref:DUF1223 domain-containing protein n=1 Tax=Rudaea sp. TaxID=2136325 RepID=UPI00321FCA81
MRILFTVPLLLIATSASAQSVCSTQSAARRPHLVELYSSEGCSSCPPAETWLRGVHDGTDAVALEFHVDYWDQLGWRDRFDDPRFTAREQAIAARDGGTAIYTPQVVIDGRNWANWYRGGRLPAAVPASASIALSATAGAPLKLRIDTQAQAGTDLSAYRNYVALVEDGLQTQVRAGENNGATLRHDHVVRAFAGPLPLAQAQAELQIPADVDLARANLVAFAQNPQDGAIAQVVRLPVAQCR